MKTIAEDRRIATTDTWPVSLLVDIKRGIPSTINQKKRQLVLGVPEIQRMVREWNLAQQESLIGCLRKGGATGQFVLWDKGEIERNGERVDVYMIYDGGHRTQIIFKFLAHPVNFFRSELSVSLENASIDLGIDDKHVHLLIKNIFAWLEDQDYCDIVLCDAKTKREQVIKLKECLTRNMFPKTKEQLQKEEQLQAEFDARQAKELRKKRKELDYPQFKKSFPNIPSEIAQFIDTGTLYEVLKNVYEIIGSIQVAIYKNKQDAMEQFIAVNTTGNNLKAHELLSTRLYAEINMNHLKTWNPEAVAMIKNIREQQIEKAFSNNLPSKCQYNEDNKEESSLYDVLRAFTAILAAKFEHEFTGIEEIFSVWLGITSASESTGPMKVNREEEVEDDEYTDDKKMDDGKTLSSFNKMNTYIQNIESSLERSNKLKTMYETVEKSLLFIKSAMAPLHLAKLRKKRNFITVNHFKTILYNVSKYLIDIIKGKDEKGLEKMRKIVLGHILNDRSKGDSMGSGNISIVDSVGNDPDWLRCELPKETMKATLTSQFEGAIVKGDSRRKKESDADSMILSLLYALKEPEGIRSEKPLTYEHIIPFAFCKKKGFRGTNNVANGCYLDEKVNASKGKMTLYEYSRSTGGGNYQYLSDHFLLMGLDKLVVVNDDMTQEKFDRFCRDRWKIMEDLLLKYFYSD